MILGLFGVMVMFDSAFSTYLAFFLGKEHSSVKGNTKFF